jgi:hypothetical protein
MIHGEVRKLPVFVALDNRVLELLRQWQRSLALTAWMAEVKTVSLKVRGRTQSMLAFYDSRIWYL